MMMLTVVPSTTTLVMTGNVVRVGYDMMWCAVAFREHSCLDYNVHSIVACVRSAMALPTLHDVDLMKTRLRAGISSCGTEWDHGEGMALSLPTLHDVD